MLLWTIGKRRRDEGGFVGADVILKQRAEKSAARKRVGFTCEGPPAREGSAILDAEGRQVGVVTSGLKGPSVGKNIGMCYVETAYQKAERDRFFLPYLGACRRRMPTVCTDLKAPDGAPLRDLADATPQDCRGSGRSPSACSEETTRARAGTELSVQVRAHAYTHVYAHAYTHAARPHPRSSRSGRRRVRSR